MSNDLAGRMADLFLEYREYMGLSDKDWPEMEPQEKQCEFEDAFAKLVCEHRGKHDMYPDQCGHPKHYMCSLCQITQAELDGVPYEITKEEWDEHRRAQNQATQG